jgi:spermidine synthase
MPFGPASVDLVRAILGRALVRTLAQRRRRRSRPVQTQQAVLAREGRRIASPSCGLQNDTTILPAAVEAPPTPEGVDARVEKLLFAGAMLLSACLLFLVQPTIAKAILPWFGGSAGVWTACMLFFQALLLLGYVYAHSIANYFSPAQQRFIHVFVLVASLSTLHFGVDPTWKPAPHSEPITSILLVLGRSVGLPYIVLCTTSPLLQHWIGQTSSLRLPYRFYALSNFGSLLALGLYPLLLEPFLDTDTQLKFWAGAYMVFVVLVIAVSVRSHSRRWPHSGPGMNDDRRLAAREACALAAVGACSSALLLSVSSSLSQDIAPIPFLWIVPLALYLLSFILCFDNARWYNVAAHRIAVPIALVALTFVHATPALPLWAALGVHCVGLFILCMFCHGLLATRRPGLQHLTAFYLWVAFGGMVGAFFVSVASPLLFNQLLEFKIAVAGCLAIALHYLYGYSSRPFLAVCSLAVVGVPVGLDYAVSSGDILVRARNFYGALSVQEIHQPDHPGGDGRLFYHGRILHGAQYGSGRQVSGPAAYYGQESGAGLSLHRKRTAQRVGIVGLGAGTLAWYGQPGDYYRFYEINPLVENIARNYFTYLTDSRAHVDVVIGDGRTALERESEQRFDTLILDAFSGDSVPVHLLTVEAFATYFRHMRSDGVVAIHISNDYLDLAPVVQAAARAHGKRVWTIHSPENVARHWSATDWAIVSGDDRFTGELQNRWHAKLLGQAIERRNTWTDRYSNLLTALR